MFLCSSLATSFFLSVLVFYLLLSYTQSRDVLKRELSAPSVSEAACLESSGPATLPSSPFGCASRSRLELWETGAVAPSPSILRTLHRSGRSAVTARVGSFEKLHLAQQRDDRLWAETDPDSKPDSGPF